MKCVVNIRTVFSILLMLASMSASAVINIDHTKVNEENCGTPTRTEALKNLPLVFKSASNEIAKNINNYGKWLPYRTWFGSKEKSLVNHISLQIGQIVNNYSVNVYCGEKAEIRIINNEEAVDDFELEVIYPKTNPYDPIVHGTELEMLVLALVEIWFDYDRKMEKSGSVDLELTLVAKKAGDPSQLQPSIYAYFWQSAHDASRNKESSTILLDSINRRLSRLQEHCKDTDQIFHGIKEIAGEKEVTVKCQVPLEGHSKIINAENSFGKTSIKMGKNYVSPYRTRIPGKQKWLDQRLISIYGSDLFFLMFALSEDENFKLPILSHSLPDHLPRCFVRAQVENQETINYLKNLEGFNFGEEKTRIDKELEPVRNDQGVIISMEEKEIETKVFNILPSSTSSEDSIFLNLLKPPNISSTQSIMLDFNIIKGANHCMKNIRIAPFSESQKTKPNIFITIGEDDNGQCELEEEKKIC